MCVDVNRANHSLKRTRAPTTALDKRACRDQLPNRRDSGSSDALIARGVRGRLHRCARRLTRSTLYNKVNPLGFSEENLHHNCSSVWPLCGAILLIIPAAFVTNALMGRTPAWGFVHSPVVLLGSLGVATLGNLKSLIHVEVLKGKQAAGAARAIRPYRRHTKRQTLSHG